jgi:hypothetical protein
MPISNSRVAARCGVAFLIWCFSCPAVLAQQAAAPTVRFTFDFPASNPLHYEVSILAGGQGSYSSRTRSDADSRSSLDPAYNKTELYQTEFTASPSTAARIFALTRQVHYFSGTVDSGDKHIAFTGAKTLSYDAPGQSAHASYNYSSLPAVRELTAIFQDLSASLEFGRRLDHDLHYQKLALEDELKHMEEMVNQDHLKEIFVVAPILQKISDDPAIMNVSRSRAQRILAKAGTGGK